MVSLAGLPLVFRDFKWPFHLSTSGADTYLVHGVVGLEDGAGSPLHAKVAASMTVTFAEVVPAPEQPYAEAFIYNAVRKTLDQGQLEMLKSGNRQPVPVTTRYYSRWQKRFVFSDTTADIAAGVPGDEGLLALRGAGRQSAGVDRRSVRRSVSEHDTGRVTEGCGTPGNRMDCLRSMATLRRRPRSSPSEAEHYRGLLAHALSLTKPEFNEEMRHGHTNM